MDADWWKSKMLEQGIDQATVALVILTKGAVHKIDSGKEWVRLRKEAEKIISAYLNELPIEYAAKHKHAGIQTEDDEGYKFENEAHFRRNFEDYGDNVTLLSRRAEAWSELQK